MLRRTSLRVPRRPFPGNGGVACMGVAASLPTLYRAVPSIHAGICLVLLLNLAVAGRCNHLFAPRIPPSETERCTDAYCRCDGVTQGGRDECGCSCTLSRTAPTAATGAYEGCAAYSPPGASCCDAAMRAEVVHLAWAWRGYGPDCQAAWETVLCAAVCAPAVAERTLITSRDPPFGAAPCGVNDTLAPAFLATYRPLVAGMGICSEDCRLLEKTCGLTHQAVDQYLISTLLSMESAQDGVVEPYSILLQCSEAMCDSSGQGLLTDSLAPAPGGGGGSSPSDIDAEEVDCVMACSKGLELSVAALSFSSGAAAPDLRPSHPLHLQALCSEQCTAILDEVAVRGDNAACQATSSKVEELMRSGYGSVGLESQEAVCRIWQQAPEACAAACGIQVILPGPGQTVAEEALYCGAPCTDWMRGDLACDAFVRLVGAEAGMTCRGQIEYTAPTSGGTSPSGSPTGSGSSNDDSEAPTRAPTQPSRPSGAPDTATDDTSDDDTGGSSSASDAIVFQVSVIVLPLFASLSAAYIYRYYMIRKKMKELNLRADDLDEDFPKQAWENEDGADEETGPAKTAHRQDGGKPGKQEHDKEGGQGGGQGRAGEKGRPSRRGSAAQQRRASATAGKSPEAKAQSPGQKPKPESDTRGKGQRQTPEKPTPPGRAGSDSSEDEWSPPDESIAQAQAQAELYAGQRWAEYKRAWDSFNARCKGIRSGVGGLGGGVFGIEYGDVPWLPIEKGDAVLAGAELRERLGVDLLELSRLWHPDRWMQRYGMVLNPKDKDRILRKVTETSQTINMIRANVVEQQVHPI